MLRKISKQKIIIQDYESELTIHNVVRMVNLMIDDSEVMSGYTKVKGLIYSVEKKPTDTIWYNVDYDREIE